MVALVPCRRPGPAPARRRQGFSRPILVLASYSPTEGVKPGDTFTLQFRLANTARSRRATSSSPSAAGDFIPAGTGGVIAAGAIAAGASTGYEQPMAASTDLTEGSIGTVTMQVSYTDPDDNPYSESFTLAIGVARHSYSLERPGADGHARVSDRSW